jgi:hypothetical protein
MEYYSALRKTDIMSLARKWKELEIIMVSAISQTETDKLSHFLTHLQTLDLKN